MNKTKSQAELIIWRLASIRLDPDVDHPELYCLILEGEKDIPLMYNDRIVFFADATRAESIINEFGKTKEWDEMDIEEPFFYCDIAMLLYTLSSEIIDKDTVVIDAINLLLDLVYATGKSIPNHYRQYLYPLADFFTFERDTSKFYKENNIEKDNVIDAVYWSIGVVTAKSTIL